LAHVWRNWRKALVFVEPDTVVRWHRDSRAPSPVPDCLTEKRGLSFGERHPV